MYTEIEAKLKVESFDLIRKKLKELRAEYVAEQSQEDVLFDDADGSLVKADSCLRLRKQVISGNPKYILTYKGAYEQSDFKKRQEIEIEVNKADATKMLLFALGYEKKITVEKKRQLWIFGGCEVALDDVSSLGTFVEIEGPDDKSIDDVQRKLGLDQLKHIPQSYASMIMDKQKQKGDE